jgi:RNA 2',3'-cyclic 3'-phosphodiesterase
MRIFTAIKLPEEIRTQVAHVSSELQKEAQRSGQRVIWVRPEVLHITFHFLGEVTESQLIIVKNILSDQVIQSQIAVLKLVSLASWPNPTQTKQIVIEVKPVGQSLVKLQQQLTETLFRVGLQLNKKPWRPHITLGRVKSHHFQLPRIHVKPLLWQVYSIDLLQSKLTSVGPVYKKLSGYKLAGKD